MVRLLLLGLVLASLVYTLAAAWLVGRLRAPVVRRASPAPAVTLLKPLYGAEPRLRENLASFLAQDYSGEVQLLCGVSSSDDPAGGVARSLGAELVAGSPRTGTNGKVSNLIGMMPHAGHDVLVLSDSDMAVPPDYLSVVIGALEGGVSFFPPRRRGSRFSSRPEQAAGSPPARGQAEGAVTCLYRGRGDAGPWSTLAAAGLSYQFLPSVVLGLAVGRAEPCMGSTVALRRETLDAIGGFARFADVLADDYALGAAVRALGLTVAVPPIVLTHGCADVDFPAVVRHELRWAATVRLIDPVGYLTTIVTHPLPLALAAALILGGKAWWLAAAALAARLLLRARVDQIVGEPSAPAWMLPPRDLLSGAMFVAGLFVRRVEWRGERLGIANDGRMELGR